MDISKIKVGSTAYNIKDTTARAKQNSVAKLGSTTKPLYTSAAGTFAECSTYAGGTAVTLNGTSKAASTASLYAPTAAGTAGQILTSSGGTPAWKTGELVHYVTNASGTAGSTASGSYNRTQWTGTCDGVTSLYTGLTVSIKIPVAGVSRGVSLNINDLGEHPVIYGTGMLTTHYPVNSIKTLTYDANATLSIYVNNTNTSFTGCWRCNADYDSTNVYQLRHNYNTVVVTTKLGRYGLMLQKTETNFVPVTAVDNSTATTKTLTTDSFNPFGDILYYSGSSAVAANGSPSASALYLLNLVDLRYSFNTGTTLTDKKDIYIVATPQADGSAKLYSTPISQTLPTSNNGLIYIKLGRSYNNYLLELFPEHPVYWFKGGKLQLYTGNVCESKAAVSSGTDLSLVTTGEKAIWDAKLSASSTLDATKLSGTIPSGCYTNTWTAASTSAAGYVPAATKGKFLHSNASTGALEWVDDNNTTYSAGTGLGLSGTSFYIPIPRVAESANSLPEMATVRFREYTAGSNYNLPTNQWYQILEICSRDSTYGTQLALCMTDDQAYYRKYRNSLWGSWCSIINTWRPLGTGATDACAGNDSRLSNSRPASDVYSWAKASSKPSYAYSEIGYTVNATSSAGGTLSLAGTTPLHVVTLTGNVSALTLSSNPSAGHSCHVILTAAAERTVAIAHDATNRVCPDAEDISLTIPAGGYVELDFLNANNKVYVRGV